MVTVNAPTRRLVEKPELEREATRRGSNDVHRRVLNLLECAFPRVDLQHKSAFHRTTLGYMDYRYSSYISSPNP